MLTVVLQATGKNWKIWRQRQIPRPWQHNGWQGYHGSGFVCLTKCLNQNLCNVKRENHLEAQDAVKHRKIASKRIHIKRIIGLTKTYIILKNELLQSKAILGSRIFFLFVYPYSTLDLALLTYKGLKHQWTVELIIFRKVL